MAKTAESARKSVQSRRPVGRPRGDGKPHLTRERVFAVSARLIAQHGFAGTSIRMIARELNASPASLFHLFESKTALLNGLIAYAASPSLAFYAQMVDLDAPPDVALYKSIYEEVRAVASADRDHAALFYLPEIWQADFAAARQVRTDMVTHYHGLIARGCAAGLLQAPHVSLAAEQVFQLTETSILAGDMASTLSPDEQAVAAADFSLRGLLADSVRLEDIRGQAARISLQIELPALARD